MAGSNRVARLALLIDADNSTRLACRSFWSGRQKGHAVYLCLKAGQLRPTDERRK